MLFKINIIDDEKNLNDLVRTYLEKEGYSVCSFYTYDEALLHKDDDVHLWLIDIMLDKASGFELFNEIKASKPKMPIIFMSARDQEFDRIIGLEKGSDDYITKPFSVTEVLARIKANIRRSTQYSKPAEPENETLVIGDLVMNLTDYTVTKKNVRVDLTAKEYEILKLLLQNPKKVYTKEQMYSLIWNDAYLGDENAVNVHISRLRNKIEDNPRSPKYVITVWGIGYKLGDLS